MPPSTRCPLIPRGAGTGVAGESLGHGPDRRSQPAFPPHPRGRQPTRCACSPASTHRGAERAAGRGRPALRPRPGQRRASAPSAACWPPTPPGSRALRHGYTRDHVASLRVVLDTGDAVVRRPGAAAAAADAEPARTCTTSLTALGGAAGAERRADRDRPAAHAVQPLRLPAARRSATSERSTCRGCWSAPRGRWRCSPRRRCGRCRCRAAGRWCCSASPAWRRRLRAAQRVLPTRAGGLRADRPPAAEPGARRRGRRGRRPDPGRGRGGAAGRVRGRHAGRGAPPRAGELVDRLQRDAAGPAGDRGRTSRTRHRAALAAARGRAAEPVRPAGRRPAVAVHRGRRRAARGAARVPAPRAGDPAGARDDGVVPDPRRRPARSTPGRSSICSKPDDVSQLWALAEKVHALALDLGGTVSTQHGTGLARTPWVARQYGPLYPVFRQVKAIFDPQDIFNPGKIVDPDPSRPAWPLRRRRPQSEPIADRWLAALAARTQCCIGEPSHCNGCGQCRTELPGQRMCPIFRATHAEAATPRAKANLLRHLLQQSADGLQLGVRRGARGRRPVRQLQDVRRRVPRPRQHPQADARGQGRQRRRARPGPRRLVPGPRRRRSLRWAAPFAVPGQPRPAQPHRRAGCWRSCSACRAERRLPRFAGAAFLRRAKRRGWTRKPARRPAASSPTSSTSSPTTTIRRSPRPAVAVLQHNGIDVLRAARPARLRHGAAGPRRRRDGPRDRPQQNLRVLADWPARAMPIVCSEPTAALMLRQDYLDLLDDRRRPRWSPSRPSS